MKRFKKLITIGLGTIVGLVAVAAISFATKAIAAPTCFQYNPNGFTTSQTPVFNNICGISGVTATTNGMLSSTEGSYPLGDEPDFVRIRSHQSDSPLGANNPKLVNNLSAACNTGDKFDIWTYVHNDAEPEFNNNGSGSAVAHDVKLAMTAPLNSTNTSFPFGGTVTASNAATVKDTATLNCNGQTVKLTLVGSSVQYNNDLSQTTYTGLPDSAVNGSTALGNPGFGSGNVWGCWPYRVVIVYTVKVEKQTPQVVPAVCTALQISQNGHDVTVNKVDFAANDSTVNNIRVDFGDGTIKTVKASDLPITHTYTGNDSRTITATLLTDKGEVTSVNCAKQVSFTTTTTTPPTTPPQVKATSLTNTGPGDVAGIFTATTIGGAFLHRKWTLRRSK